MFKRLFGVFVAVLIAAIFLACSNEQDVIGKSYEYEGGKSSNTLRYSVTLRGTTIENGVVEKKGERYVISMKWLKTYQGKADEIEVVTVGNFSGEEETDIYLLFQSDGEYTATSISDWRQFRATRGVRSVRDAEDVEITQEDMNIVAQKFQTAFDAISDKATVIPEVSDGVKLVANYPVIIVNPGDIDFSDYNFGNAYTPKTQQILYENGKIYAAVQFMDGWYPAANSQILEINAQTGEVLRKFESNFMNVQQIVIRGNDLFVVDGGSLLSTGDGGITKINLTSGAKNTITLSGNSDNYDPMQLAFVGDDRGYLVMDPGDWPFYYLAEFTLNGNTMSLDFEKFEDDIYSVGDISYNYETGDLWIAHSSKVYKYSASQDILTEYSISPALQAYSIKSAGNATLVAQVDGSYTAGAFGTIIGGSYSQKGQNSGDPVAEFANGKFYILDRTTSGVEKIICLDANFNIVDNIILDYDFLFNPSGIVGDGNGNLWVNSYEELFIKVLRQ